MGVRTPNVGGIDGELAHPDQPCGDALPDDVLEDAAEDRQPIAIADAGQAGMVWSRVVADGPNGGGHQLLLPYRLELKVSGEVTGPFRRQRSVDRAG